MKSIIRSTMKQTEDRKLAARSTFGPNAKTLPSFVSASPPTERIAYRFFFMQFYSEGDGTNTEMVYTNFPNTRHLASSAASKVPY